MRQWRCLAAVGGMAVVLGLTGCGQPAAPTKAAPATDAAADAAASKGQPAANPAVPLKQFANPDRGFSIGYPLRWQPLENYFGTAIAFVGPAATTGGTMPTANVVLETIPAGTTLAGYFDASRRNLSGAIQLYKEASAGDTTLAGQEAKYLLTTYRSGNRPVQAIAWFLLSGDQAAVITCATSPQEFVKARPTFEAIASSFTISAPAAAAKPADAAAQPAAEG
ncbi:MAG: DcrB-related protein [Fimbriimonadaceae bacterium]|nr:DcrB-related protein [Fimbriimonadaceae bacterium]